MFEYSILEVNADTNTIKSKVPDDITLYDHVMVLNYKTDWVVIHLDLLLLNPIIHIKNGDECL